MSDLGDLLRKAREEYGYSLEDIQDLTKIRKRYLEAIEEGNYAVLPGSFYVRAFVKNYAENVGLDADEVLRLYQKEIPTSAPDPVVETVQRPRRSQNQHSDRWSKWGFRALMWSFLILIVVIVYIFAINRPTGDGAETLDGEPIINEKEPAVKDKDKNNTQKGGEQGAKPPVQKPDPDPTPETPQTRLTFVKSTGKTDYYVLSPGKHKIELKTSGGGSWVGISEKDKNGAYLLTDTMKDGATATVETEAPFYINIARANIVTVTIDGIVLEDGDKESTKKFQVDPEPETPSGQQQATN
ncbi:helix-turn-helix domain-containing protein [Paenibacillus sp. GCM10027626]|uniref:helix-turn-helix domain-containing protein n=1 Tax=Paenibacillus sp. GCM10027626 TaxID=3273411 RepID=UPI003640125D